MAELKKNPNFNATYNLYGFAWAFKMSNPNVALISSPEKMSQAWFKASAEFIKGLDDQDGTFFQDDQVNMGMVLDSQQKMLLNKRQCFQPCRQIVHKQEMLQYLNFVVEFDALKKEVYIKRPK
ncbi:hypothetical protein Tco_1492412 [Tanacetum coccineum]